jgi:hypothetical protein
MGEALGNPRETSRFPTEDKVGMSMSENQRTSVEFTAAETQALANLPRTDLVDLAIELDILVPAEINRMGLLGEIVVALVQRARAEGLPFSEYDREDLESLPEAQRQALGRLCGGDGSVEDLLRRGKKTYKRYQSERPRSQVAMVLPSLLGPLSRHLARGGR